ncbi:MAG: DUF3037 domain-containing protein [Polaromonas sp.]|nr:DUF3037 domain-containing protein [Polaromonas sp.]
MKATTYIINYQPYPARAEHCSVGALVFNAEGSARAHLATNLKKLKALDPQSSVEILHDSLKWLVSEINKNQDAWNAFRHGFSSLRFSKDAGYFLYETDAEYDKQVKWLLSVSSEPRSSRQGEIRKPKSRLFIELRDTFKAYGWLGDSVQDINNHQVVTNFPVSLDEDLSAEFAMKNGILHLAETVDFRNGVSNVKKMEARGKALVFDFAKEQIKNTACTVIVAAGDYADVEIKRSMNMLNRYSDRVACYDSSEGHAVSICRLG